MSATSKIFLLLIQTTAIIAALPPLQKCRLEDSECLKKSAESIMPAIIAGVPDVGTDVLEPARIQLIKIDLSGLKLTIKDSYITGLEKAVIDDINFDTGKKIFHLNLHVAPITLKGKYKASGQLLILPIEGEGDTTVKIKNLKFAMTMPYDIIKNENGKDVIDLKSMQFTYENRENTHFKLTNLFHGNKNLSDAMHTFMNENWSLISQEFGTPIIEKAIQKIFKAIKTYLRSQPLEDIAIYKK